MAHLQQMHEEHAAAQLPAFAAAYAFEFLQKVLAVQLLKMAGAQVPDLIAQPARIVRLVVRGLGHRAIHASGKSGVWV